MPGVKLLKRTLASWTLRIWGSIDDDEMTAN